MIRRTSKSDYRLAFAEALSRELDKRRMLQSDLARALNIDRSYVHRLVRGITKVSPEQTNAICESMGLTEEERVRLHRAAAKTWGFELDLTKR